MVELHFVRVPCKCDVYTKAQIKSEWVYEIINFPKNELKNLKDFCLMYYKNSQGRNPSNF